MSDNDNQNQPTKQQPTEQELENLIKKIREELNIQDKKIKIQVVNASQIQHIYKRLGKVSNFHYIGALLCMAVGLYFAKSGSQVVPMVLGFVMCVNVILALLAYRATTRVEKFIQMVQHHNKNIKR